MSKSRTLEPELSTARTAIPATRRYEPLSLRIDDAASITGISESKLKRLVTDKAIPSFMIDGCRLVLWEDLRTFILSQAMRGRPVLADAPLAQAA